MTEKELIERLETIEKTVANEMDIHREKTFELERKVSHAVNLLINEIERETNKRLVETLKEAI